MFSQIYFFVPGVSQNFQSGGLRVTQQTRRFFQEIFPDALCEMVATHERAEGALFAQDVFTAEKLLTESPNSHAEKNGQQLCIVTWGPLVKDHIALIRKNLPRAHIIFYAQSFGWGIPVPAGIPIVCVSRFVMSQWALYSKGNFVGYVPPSLSGIHFSSQSKSQLSDDVRPIDILVHTRKQNSYCIEKIVPALKKRGLKIHRIEEWIDQSEFSKLLAQSKIFLYATALHKAGFFRRLPGEGFGLPPLEALAKGCMVASNLLGGVTDFLTPTVNCVKIQTHSVQEDVAAIEDALKNFTPTYDEKLLSEYAEENVKNRWATVLHSLFSTL